MISLILPWRRQRRVFSLLVASLSSCIVFIVYFAVYDLEAATNSDGYWDSSHSSSPWDRQRDSTFVNQIIELHQNRDLDSRPLDRETDLHPKLHQNRPAALKRQNYSANIAKENNKTMYVAESTTVTEAIKINNHRNNNNHNNRYGHLFPTGRCGAIRQGDAVVGEDRMLLQNSLKVEDKKCKVILLYYFDTVTTDDKLKGCSVSNCKFSRRPEDFQIADAVLFRQFPKDLKRPAGKPDQIWIFVSLESPMHQKGVPEGITVNWTATYRMDSVLPTPYDMFYTNEQLRAMMNQSSFGGKKSRNHAEKSRNSGIDRTFNQGEEKLNHAKGKTKLVAWFVSNCRASNARMEYVRELQKYVDVDVYGSCGTLKCSRGDDHWCQRMLTKTYKFYLAFENSNCRDYITEKFFRTLRSDVVPIVMGGHPDDYKHLAPEGSYIHVSQFRGARELANYLKILDGDDNLYNSYFAWKGEGQFRDTPFVCRLCALLHIATYCPVWYENFNEWWSQRTCLSKNQTWSW